MFARNTLVCPRCDRVNDRSLCIIGLKVLALALSVCAVVWVVRYTANFGMVPGDDASMPVTEAAPGHPSDVRF